jgi:hypothetical protein
VTSTVRVAFSFNVSVGGVGSIIDRCTALALFPWLSGVRFAVIFGLAAEPAPLLSDTVTVGAPQLSNGGPAGSGLPFSQAPRRELPVMHWPEALRSGRRNWHGWRRN